MPTAYTTDTFLNSYYDDFVESDGYARVLFNSGKALQARELTQLQTIIQKQIERFGRNIFKEGAAVNPGGMTINPNYEFIKLASGTTLPSDTSVLVGTIFTGQTSGVKVKVLEVVAATDSDPDTLYVTYTDTSSATAGSTAIRMSAGELVDNGTYSFTVQSTNTTVNPAVGVGTRVSVAKGDFFTQGFFAFAPAQSKIIEKYSGTPTADVGFKVVQDIVTSNDTNDLYDNSNDLTPNLSAPGADRFRLQLTVATRDELDSDETFVYVGKIQNGQIVDEVEGNDDYNIINDLLATRTKEESGNYNVKPFTVKFEENDSDNTKLDLKISDGISYVNGYRAALDYPSVIQVSKAQDTTTLNNEVVAANFGNYVLGTNGNGLPNISEFEKYNLRSATGYGGSTIGSARIKAVEEDGSNYRYYLFDVKMNSGQSFRSVRSAGVSASNYFDLVLENSQAVIKETANNDMLFGLPTERPKSLSDISLTAQRRFFTTTNGSGEATLTLTAPGETFANTTSWTIANADSDIHDGFAVTGAGTASATITGGPASSSNLEVIAYVNKAQGSSRTKTLNEVTKTGLIESDGDGLKFFSLGFADIYDVSRIRLTDSDGADLSNRFTLDNGQRDNFYDIGRLVLNGGQTAPTGNMFARYRYFSHGTSGDFFSVNSYTGQINYADIPSYRTNAGETVQLRNVLDFRGIKDSASGDFSGTNARVNELPENTDLITADVVYYQPRYSKLVVDTSANLSVISGPSSLNPILPPTPANALELYNIKLNPFTLNDSDMTIEKIETKRYTMADIGRLESRVDQLEEITSLSLLELDTANFDVLDSSGVNRTKSGFLVDNFKDHFFADTTSVEYAASIDPDNRLARPGFNAENVRLIYDSDKSTNTVIKGDNVYLKYTEVDQINQNLATTTENVNPFAVITHQGNLTLSPSSDNWADQKRIPARVIDGGTTVIERNLARNWNNWLWNWSGRTLSFGNTINETQVGSATRSSSTATSVSRRGDTTTTTISQTQVIREVIGDRVVDVALVPFMRSQKVYFKAEGMRPNSRLFAFFDGTSVNNWVREESYVTHASNTTEYGNSQNGATQHPDVPSTLTTDAEGKIEGSFFVPNTSSLKFRAGTREFKLLDISANNNDAALSIARSLYTSSGIIQTIQADIVSTRRVITSTITRVDRDDNDDRGMSVHERRDPLAQSFYVEDPNGIFVTSVDLYFSTKDDTIPVELQIRPLVNGVPSSTEIVPGARKFLSPSSVNTSSNASIATKFTFDEPIFLAPLTEYAIVALAESTDYNVYVAEAGGFILGSTERRVSRQPTMGSLFKSQNGTTWSADQTKDMMFRIRRANFTNTSGTVVLENAALPKTLLDPNPITVDSGSSSVFVAHQNHGFSVGDDVTITGVDSSSTIGGISGTSVLGTRSITAVDWTGYKFSADSAGTSNEIGGGSNVLATQNILFDVFVPSIETMVPNSTTASYTGKFTTGKSFAGSETPYQKDTTAQDIFLLENNFVQAPRIIANSVNEAAELGAGVKSTTINVDISTTASRVSPVIDMQRASLFLINNVVDNQDSAATSGFNVPINFVSETDPSAGSSAAKHVTKPVTLEETAVGMKILIGANRPSTASFDVYYRVGGDGDVLGDQNWIEIAKESSVPSDENPNIYREYEYLVGGQGGNIDPFTQFQIKVVLNSTNSSRVPVLKDLRVIALSV
jgi:hypothetical protein